MFSGSVLGLITPQPALVATPGRACSPRMMANWDPVRFATTAAFFNAPPSPGELLKRVLTPSPALSRDGQLWSAERPELLEWGPLDDVVMGGVSRSTFVTGSSCATFSGVVTSENNGGFVGCRTRALRPALDLRRFEGLRLRLRGDGNRYKLILRDDYAWNGIAWAFSFDTSKELQTIEAPFPAFVPTLFARSVPGKKLDTRAINTLQLTLSKFEYDGALNPAFTEGAFRLELESIEAF